MGVFEVILVIIFSALCVSSSPVQHQSNRGQISCIHNNKTYTAGEKFKPDACTFCHCQASGRALCSIMDCLFEPNCLEYTKDPNVCCQRCVKRGCQHTDGKIYLPGEEVSVTPCEYCFCPRSGGRTECVKSSCPRLVCVDPVKKEGDCCPRCPHGRSCWLGNRVIRGRGHVKVGRCKTCRCPSHPAPFWRTGKDVKAICTMKVTPECVDDKDQDDAESSAIYE